MKFFKCVSFLAFMALSLNSVAAVDGVKPYKFGMDVQTVK